MKQAELMTQDRVAPRRPSTRHYERSDLSAEAQRAKAEAIHLA